MIRRLGFKFIIFFIGKGIVVVRFCGKEKSIGKRRSIKKVSWVMDMEDIF